MTRHIDWDKVDHYFMAGSSITQCAAALGVSVDTLERKAISEKNARIADIQQQKREKGNLAIHAAQYEKAIKDRNPTMLIWLGKQRLQQKDSHDATPLNDDPLTKALESIMSSDVEKIKVENEELKKELEYLRKKESASPYENISE